MSELVSINETGLKSFNSVITSPKTQDYLQSVLGERKGSFVNNITALVSNNIMLQDCKPLTLLYAALKATALDLPLDANLGFAYVLPYNSKTGKEGQFQLGYKGFIQLALRSGQFRVLNATDVRDGEIISRDRLTGDIKFNFIEDEQDRAKKEIIGYVSYFELNNGFRSTLYMSKEELKSHGLRFSKSFGSKYKDTADRSLWNTDFDAMARKTVIKLNLSRNAPLSAELRQAVTFDQAVIREPEVPTYVDNEKEIDYKEVIELNTELFYKCARDLVNGIKIEQIRTKYDIDKDVELAILSEADRLKNEHITNNEYPNE